MNTQEGNKSEYEKILEGNRLIAEYDNFVVIGTDPLVFSMLNSDGSKNGLFHLGNFKYHCDWQHLMPVVLKILDENSSSCYLAPSHFFSGTGKGKWDFTMLDDQINSQNCVNDNPITAVWAAVVQYLKNKQQ